VWAKHTAGAAGKATNFRGKERDKHGNDDT